MNIVALSAPLVVLLLFVKTERYRCCILGCSLSVVVSSIEEALSLFPRPRDLEEALEMGVDWSLREGYAWAEDKEHCEEYGRMLQADPNKVSARAKKRGLPQVVGFLITMQD